mmetsp:Transcript_17231/g.37479  ORF Transcript_17231/g.37479 Transcript_17231/m.37479 type:complete len:253 (-) Transcript_17231:299-1057(-)|eukprot:CAMPEP_0118933926 /NCGR_PEP_ID=MMETSP1169-20130426/13040_1 /TAXON_ID=36882 /ORGANISM="Pyramimonas obovata, Strain CCMP722" /LENGTH=252 /DNA_ID=CAMNT_0006876765 /DNA_START=181 /DNA_END=939 /DNA_ORIENTATION=+
MASTSSLTVPSCMIACTQNVHSRVSRVRMAPTQPAAKSLFRVRTPLTNSNTRANACFVGSPRALERRGTGNKAARRGVVSVSASDDDFLDAIDKANDKPMSFMDKLVAAFQIFFPPKQEESSARIEAKKRLRMILVADRCSMNPSSLKDMKKSIVSAISDYVEVDKNSDVDLSVSTHPDLGTIYSVSVPVKRVKSQFDVEDMETEIDGMTFKFETEESEDKAGNMTKTVTVIEKKKVEQKKEEKKEESEKSE